MRLLLVLAACASLAATAAGAQSCDYKRPYAAPPGYVPTYSIATVYADAGGTNVRGSATLIDKQRRLLITAAHVVKDGKAFVRFRGLADEVFEAQVVMRLPDAIDDGQGSALDTPRDIVVLRATALPPLAHPLDLRSIVDSDGEVNFYGFPAGVQSALVGRGKASTISADGKPAARCARALREATLGGDSGSAMVSESAYVVGVTSVAIQQGELNIFIPTACFFDEVIESLGEDKAQATYELFTTKSQAVILNTLAANPADSKVSNLDLFIAASRLIEEGRWQDVLRCPIVPMAFQRGVPIDLFAKRAAGTAQKVAIADALSASAARNAADARVAGENVAKLRAALEIYEPVLRPQLENITAANAALKLSTEQIVALKSAADAATLLTLLTEDKSTYADLTKKASLVSAAATQNPQLRGAALATFGQASADDPATAYSAFQAARKEGFSPEWVRHLEQEAGRKLTASDRAAAAPLDINASLKALAGSPDSP
ncbi:serine protease [Caulobacter sp. 73W]|uniref:Serine protease n=1 Tax=Caulobacter sp. 73W TaxID=3161137 RepID=A0AB39KQW8_9CAUL